MSFGTKKKKRSWRDAEETDGPAAATAEEGGADSEEEELDEAAIEEEMRRVEKEEEEERERLATIQAAADARRAARQAKVDEAKAAEKPKWKLDMKAVDAGAAAAAAEAEDDGTCITDTMCREGRCVRVDNVNFKSNEDDIRMLFEGDDSFAPASIACHPLVIAAGYTNEQ